MKQKEVASEEHHSTLVRQRLECQWSIVSQTGILPLLELEAESIKIQHRVGIWWKRRTLGAPLTRSHAPRQTFSSSGNVLDSFQKGNLAWRINQLARVCT